jgi:transcription initiation factor TFIID TATA-box-binding protein
MSYLGLNTEYNPNKFAAVTMRIRKPRTTCLIFSSGYLNCTGAKTVDDARVALRRFARIIQKLGFPVRINAFQVQFIYNEFIKTYLKNVKFKNFRIRNIVSNFNHNWPLQLAKMAVHHGTQCSYEPEIFPALTYKLPDPKISFNIFGSGNFVMTGTTFYFKLF